jgi:adenosylcobyric acid synthase
MPQVLESFGRLSSQADLILVEGAGSPAEVNLRAADIANMGFAEAADIPAVLIGDIDRGGVIASIVGTDALLAPGERARLKGYIINKFRGEIGLFDGALDIIAEKTGLDCLGIVPYFPEASLLPAEDAVALDHAGGRRARPDAGAVTVAVPRLPRIANFDDLDPLAAEEAVTVEIVEPGRALPGEADLILLPGSKSTLADLAFLKREGWDIDILAHARRGGMVVGLCAGYQMLGRRIADPDGVEGPAGEVPGLGLLEVETVLGGTKTLRQVHGRDVVTGAPVTGYEMHMGVTRGPGCERPMLDLDGRPDGARSADGRILGCYLHGLFAADGFRRAFLSRLREGLGDGVAYETQVEETLDKLADHLAAALDLDRLLEIARGR